MLSIYDVLPSGEFVLIEVTESYERALELVAQGYCAMGW
jgi:hypothetical protein